MSPRLAGGQLPLTNTVDPGARSASLSLQETDTLDG